MISRFGFLEAIITINTPYHYKCNDYNDNNRALWILNVGTDDRPADYIYCTVSFNGDYNVNNKGEAKKWMHIQAIL